MTTTNLASMGVAGFKPASLEECTKQSCTYFHYMTAPVRAHGNEILLLKLRSLNGPDIEITWFAEMEPINDFTRLNIYYSTDQSAVSPLQRFQTYSMIRSHIADCFGNIRNHAEKNSK